MKTSLTISPDFVNRGGVTYNETKQKRSSSDDSFIVLKHCRQWTRLKAFWWAKLNQGTSRKRVGSMYKWATLQLPIYIVNLWYQHASLFHQRGHCLSEAGTQSETVYEIATCIISKTKVKKEKKKTFRDMSRRKCLVDQLPIDKFKWLFIFPITANTDSTEIRNKQVFHFSI